MMKKFFGMLVLLSGFIVPCTTLSIQANASETEIQEPTQVEQDPNAYSPEEISPEDIIEEGPWIGITPDGETYVVPDQIATRGYYPGQPTYVDLGRVVIGRMQVAEWAEEMSSLRGPALSFVIEAGLNKVLTYAHPAFAVAGSISMILSTNRMQQAAVHSAALRGNRVVIQIRDQNPHTSYSTQIQVQEIRDDLRPAN